MHELYVNVGDTASGGVLFIEDFALNAVPKPDSSNELWQLILTVYFKPVFSASRIILKTASSVVLNDKQPFARLVRWRTVAKVLSIGLTVRAVWGSWNFEVYTG